MRKLWALLLVFVLSFSLVACGNDKDDKEKDKDDKKKTEESADKDDSDKIGDALEGLFGGNNSDDNADIDSDVSVDEDVDDNDFDLGLDSDNGAYSITPSSIQDTVIVDCNELKVTATELTVSDDYIGAELKLKIENKSSQDLSVSCDWFAINGIIIDEYFSCDVTAGKNAIESLTIYSSDLETNKIGLIQSIDLAMYATDSDYNTVVEKTAANITTDAPTSYVQEFAHADAVIYDADGFKVTIMKNPKYNPDDYSPMLLVMYENNTDKYVTFSTDDTSVDGFMFDIFMYSSIPAGMKKVEGIYVDQEDMEEYDLTSIDNLEGYIKIYDAETYDDYVEDTEFSVTIK